MTETAVQLVAVAILAPDTPAGPDLVRKLTPTDRTILRRACQTLTQWIDDEQEGNQS